MKWIAISGSWHKTTPEIEKKIRQIVREVINRGDGIVSGGALGVDYIALDEALKCNPSAERIRVFLPTTLQVYATHYRKHAKLGDITTNQAEKLIAQLNKLKRANNKALIENPNTNFNEETKKKMYYERNSKIVEMVDELVAFQVNKSPGTQDAIDKSHCKGIPVKVFSYILK